MNTAGFQHAEVASCTPSCAGRPLRIPLYG